MQAAPEKIKVIEAKPNKLRIAELVKTAAESMGGYNQLAKIMDVQPQLVSNWKNGVKTPSPEAQAEMATFAGLNAMVVNLMATMEKTTGKRYERLQSAYKQWMQEQTLFQEWKQKANITKEEARIR